MVAEGVEAVRLAPVDTWPDLRLTVHLLPWAWKLRPRVYADDVEGPMGFSSFEWFFIHVEWWGNRPLFRERTP